MYIPREINNINEFETWIQDENHAHILSSCEIKFKECPLSQKKQWCGNIYELTDRLIENAGRFCTMHSSDIIIGINALYTALESHDFGQKTCFIFAVRKFGVDSNDAFFQNHNNKDIAYLEQYYRSVLVVYMDNITQKEAAITLKQL